MSIDVRQLSAGFSSTGEEEFTFYFDEDALLQKGQYIVGIQGFVIEYPDSDHFVKDIKIIVDPKEPRGNKLDVNIDFKFEDDSDNHAKGNISVIAIAET